MVDTGHMGHIPIYIAKRYKDTVYKTNSEPIHTHQNKFTTSGYPFTLYTKPTANLSKLYKTKMITVYPLQVTKPFSSHTLYKTKRNKKTKLPSGVLHETI